MQVFVALSALQGELSTVLDDRRIGRFETTPASDLMGYTADIHDTCHPSNQNLLHFFKITEPSTAHSAEFPVKNTTEQWLFTPRPMVSKSIKNGREAHLTESVRTNSLDSALSFQVLTAPNLLF